MSSMTFDAFRAHGLAQGFDEVVERYWAPDTVLEIHTHPFSVKALVVAGEMWLTEGDVTRHLLAGDTFAIGDKVPHAERYGPDGATYWVARRNCAATNR